jgi:tungstate transport system substrate-binding protein
MRFRPRSFGLAAVIGISLLAIACSSGGEGELLLATTTSVNDSGLLDDLVPIFEDETGINVKVIAVGTGAALRMGELGNADALFVHAPSSEKELVSAGDVINRQLVAFNDFLIVGPADDPAALAGITDIESALRLINDAEANFVSRGDDSGTHKKELALWAAAGIQPSGDWYLESGQGMGATLNVADQRNGYILTDRATFLALSDNLELVPLSETDPLLINLYSAMQVNPDKGRINADAASTWIDFLLRDDIQMRIGEFRREEFGRSLFVPAGGQTEAQATARFSGG